MVDAAKDLQIRLAEREALLQRIIRQLDKYERVVAAWLAGSLGRDDDGGLSDVDVKV